MRRIGIILGIILGWGALSAQYNPGSRWDFRDLFSNEHWEMEEVMKFNRFIIDSTHITGLMIVHEGEVIFDYGDVEEVSYIGACRQSILAMLYGKYVEEGNIDLNATLGDLGVDDVNPLLPEEKKATVLNLLEGRSGIFLEDGYSGQPMITTFERGDPNARGSWMFSNWNIDVANYILESTSGNDVFQEFENQIALPLQFEDWDRSLQVKVGNPEKSRYQAFPIWLSTRDMARIGWLMYNKGSWNAQQLINEEWINEMIKPRTSAAEVNESIPFFKAINESFGYGLMWWLAEYENNENLEGAYVTFGSMGQCIAVFPAIHTVLAYKTHNKYWRNNSDAIRVEIVKRVADLYQN